MPPLHRRGGMGDRSRRTAGAGVHGGRFHSSSAGVAGTASPAAGVAGLGQTPSDPAPLNGGEFLLQLLRKPPPSGAAAPSPSSLTPPLPIDGQRGRQNLQYGQYEDPAVAAVGPSHPFSPPNFSNVGSPQQQQFPPWLFPPVQAQPPRPSPSMGFSPPGGFSASPPTGFSASPPGVSYHDPRAHLGGNRPPFFQGETGQSSGFIMPNPDSRDRRGNPRDAFSQQQHQQQDRRPQPNSNYKQIQQQDGSMMAGGTPPANIMFGSQPSNRVDGVHGRVAGNPPVFTGRSQLGAEQWGSKSGPSVGNDRRLGNGGSLENWPLPNSRRAPEHDIRSSQSGNHHCVRETTNSRRAPEQDIRSSQSGNHHCVRGTSKGRNAPMAGQAPPGFQDLSVQRRSQIESRREASSSQQNPNGSGNKLWKDRGSDGDVGTKRPEFPQRNQNNQSFSQRMGTQVSERHVKLNTEHFSSVPAADIDVKDLVDDLLSEDEDEEAEQDHDNVIEHNSESKPISGSSIYEEKRLVTHLQDSLVLNDEVVDCEVKKSTVSRKKDFRTDFSRGHKVSTQKFRLRRVSMPCRRDIKRLNPELLSIYGLLVPTDEQKAKQKRLLNALRKIVSREWPSAQLHLYGSCANSFGVLKSDVDVCLEIDVNEENKCDLLLNLAEVLQSDNLQNVQALTRARVPIVKLMDPDTGLSCDICINNLLAVVNTKLLRDYGKIDERLRQLAFIVKHWAKTRGVNETYQGTLSSYAYVIMCIHFLQMRRPPILPCLQSMKPTYITTVDGVECSFFDQVEKLQNFGSENKESVAELLWAFFNYWAYRHDYANDVISVRNGYILRKREKDWTRRIGNDRHLICIEDPFEVSHDLGRVVDKHTIKILREEFERAADILQFEPNPCALLFEPYVREPPPEPAENESQLGAV